MGVYGIGAPGEIIPSLGRNMLLTPFGPQVAEVACVTAPPALSEAVAAAPDPYPGDVVRVACELRL